MKNICMPELPEVETIKSYIKPLLTNQKFAEVEVINPNLRIAVPDDLAEKLEDQLITNIERRAKYIAIYLESGCTLIIHLGMTGKITVHQQMPETTKHDHLIFKFHSGDYLTFNDARRFGLVTYIDSNDLNSSKLFSHLGLEPLSDEFTGKHLKEISKKSVLEIKKFIMDQKNVVGVGNIYASEALFMSNIHPKRHANKLSLPDCEELVKNIKIILKQAIASGGSTIKDYRLANGESGYFQHEFKTYGKENNPCKICSTPIEKIVQGGRSTFYCPKCQKN